MVYFLFLLPVVIVASIIGRNPRATTPIAWFVVYFVAFLISGLFLGVVFSTRPWLWGLLSAALAVGIRWSSLGAESPTPTENGRHVL